VTSATAGTPSPVDDDATMVMCVPLTEDYRSSVRCHMNHRSFNVIVGRIRCALAAYSYQTAGHRLSYESTVSH
jgi:hypothetical protein